MFRCFNIDGPTPRLTATAMQANWWAQWHRCSHGQHWTKINSWVSSVHGHAYCIRLYVIGSKNILVSLLILTNRHRMWPLTSWIASRVLLRVTGWRSEAWSQCSIMHLIRDLELHNSIQFNSFQFYTRVPSLARLIGCAQFMRPMQPQLNYPYCSQYRCMQMKVSYWKGWQFFWHQPAIFQRQTVRHTCQLLHQYQ